MQENNVFIFMVLVYNHEKYIIEHLESIKYLVDKYGKDYQVDLYINDDASKDFSKNLIERWLLVNSGIFRDVKVFFNTRNIGTCKSICNMLNAAPNDVAAIKLTGGDDIYSFENIFEVCAESNSYSFLSGIPLHFSGNDLYLDKAEYFGLFASQVNYKNKYLLERFKFLSINNAPNLFYNPKYLTSEMTLSFLSKFDVVEDWPIQIAIAEQTSNQPYVVKNKVYVYYRRTQGSTYIVANRRFINDKVKVYDYLESCSSGVFERFLIRNRRFLFVLNNSKLNKLLNVSFYLFLIKSLLNFKAIKSLGAKNVIATELHNSHLGIIKKRASDFLESNSDNEQLTASHFG